MAAPHSQYACTAVKVSFRNLPRELRDILYHELWSRTRRLYLIHTQGPRSKIEIHYGGRPTFDQRIHSRLPRWLMCNRQFLQEGFCQLLKHALWYCDINNERHSFSVGRMGLNYAHLIDLTAITDLTLTTPMQNGNSERNRHDHIQLAPDMRYIRPIWVMCDLVGPKLEHLTLDALHYWIDRETLLALSETPFDGMCTVDLSPLERIKLPLRSLTIRASLAGTANPHTIKEKLGPAYERGVKGLGGAMVGHNGQIEVESFDLRSTEGYLTRYHWDMVLHLRKP
jgi:hypothetical protein